MKILQHPNDIREQLHDLRHQGKSIGLVPTMGALHAGHLSLIQHARQACDVTVATIFVNPTQFGPNEDFAKYPRTLTSDESLLRDAGCDFLMVPDNTTMYPPGFSTYVEPPRVSQRWDGEKRPGHFRGVATIVLKLFQMIPCHQAFFGLKDYQQFLVIQSMARDFNLPIQVVGCPIVREPDGLAMSSRNRYLNPDEREKAIGLSLALHSAQEALRHGETLASTLERQMLAVLEKHQITDIDYAVVADAATLEPVSVVQEKAIALLAVRVGSTRLIDNSFLSP